MATSDGSSDEFYECESPSKINISRNSKENPFDFSSTPSPAVSCSAKEEILEIQRQQETKEPPKDDFKFKEPRTHRQRFKELKSCMNDDDGDEAVNDSQDPSNSSAKSVDASSSKNALSSSHPFRVIDNDGLSIHSMQSLGRVGRILSGSLDPAVMNVKSDSQVIQRDTPISQESPPAMSPRVESPSKASSSDEAKGKNEDSHSQCSNYSGIIISKTTILQEPDVIASTKLAHSKTTDSITSSGSGVPVAPPRRKRRNQSRKVSESSDYHNYDGVIKSQSDGKMLESLQATTITTSSVTTSMSTSTTSDSNVKSSNIPAELSSSNKDKILPSPATLYAITKEIENSFQEASSLESPSSIGIVGSPSNISRFQFSGSLNKIPSSAQQLPQTSTSTSSYQYKSSPSNSVKSNSAPGRVTSIDHYPTMSIHKVTQGNFCVRPQDELNNKAEGPSEDERKKSIAGDDVEKLKRLKSEAVENYRAPIDRLRCIGSNSLGNDSRYRHDSYSESSKERRKSAGNADEVLKQLNVNVRLRSESGQQLTDQEILDQVPVRNLDTGENFPLSVADEKTEQCINPLSLYIMQYASHIRESDEESIGGMTINSEVPPGEEEEIEEEEGRLKRKTARIKKFFKTTAQKAANKAKSIASEVSHARHKEDIADIRDVSNPDQTYKLKASKTHSGPYEFANIQHIQDLSTDSSIANAVWCMKFSPCGRLLATGGQDRLLRIWVLKDAYHHFEDLIKKFNADQKSSPTPSQESLVSHQSFEESAQILHALNNAPGPFVPIPYRTYSGHTSDLLDVSWSKSHFVLSSSMDKTVRLWHISRRECLCCFQHIEFVTAIAFHPQDDSFFLSGSLDGRLRLWNIPNKKVFLWNEVDGRRQLITAVNFCQNGKFAVVGTYDGRCLFYHTDQLKYHTQIHVRSTRGKNATGRKITGIEPMPNEDKILVTSNDSRIRMYDLRDLNLSCKYKGYVNDSQQIKASFSHDGKYIISGSENQCIYIWKTHHDFAKLSSVRRDRSDFWEGIKAHNITVTCAIFSPHPETIIKPEFDMEMGEKEKVDPLVEQRTKGCGGYVLVSVDFTGCIKVFINKTKPKHSSLPYSALN